MGAAALLIGSSFSWRFHERLQMVPPPPSHNLLSHCSPKRGLLEAKATAAESRENNCVSDETVKFSGTLRRRWALLSGVSLASALLILPGEGIAAVKQGLLAGRIPGLSEPDEQGWRTYRRPDEKSGGHGVGWSPIIPYVFSVPEDWEEVPVSIADLGGTEIDLRFASSKEGRLYVIVAPVLRFADSELFPLLVPNLRVQLKEYERISVKMLRSNESDRPRKLYMHLDQRSLGIM